MKLTIRTRLMAAFALVIAIAVGQGLLGAYEMRALNASATVMNENYLPSVAVSSAINTAASDFRISILRHVLATTPDAKAAIEAESQKVLAELKSKDDNYQKLVSSPEERAQYERFAGEWKEYVAHRDELFALSRAGKTAEAQAVLASMSKHFDASSAALDDIVAANMKGAADQAAAGHAAYTQGLWTTFGALAAMIAAGLVIAWRLSGDLSRRMSQAVAVTGRIAHGELNQDIRAEGGDEIATLLNALRGMQSKLAEVVSGVRQNAEGVATASAQIAQGNADLSNRTEQQAASLEETAASMEEMNSTAMQNADNAAQANQLAMRASDVAREGGTVVGNVVSTMKEIEASSRQIVDIISVIDGIAFQTNILALNAAVEAARAGEQGRGFAVVASEVRSLAQRSAEAAKQIKGLIATSVERVETGTALVDRAGTTMQDIVGSIQRVTDIIGEISAASREQMSGIGQTSEAVANMDQTTQQNAALVEESAAAAESLRHQAEALVQMVGVFKLGHGDVTPRRAAAAPAATAKPAAKAGWNGTERRSPSRAKNVVRPKFDRAAKPGAAVPAADMAKAQAASEAPARTGTDGDWETF